MNLIRCFSRMGHAVSQGFCLAAISIGLQAAEWNYQFTSVPLPEGPHLLTNAVFAGDSVVVLDTAVGSERAGLVSLDPRSQKVSWSPLALPSDVTAPAVAVSYGAGRIYVAGANGRVVSAAYPRDAFLWNLSSQALPVPAIRLAVLGENLVATGMGVSQRPRYGKAVDQPLLSNATVSNFQGLAEVARSVRDLGGGIGWVGGSAGLVRLSTNSGANWSILARAPGSLSEATDGIRHGGRLYVTFADGTVSYADLNAGLAGLGWNWVTERPGGVGSTNALRTLAVVEGELLAAGDRGSAFLRSATSGAWKPVALSAGEAGSSSWVHVSAPTEGSLSGLLIAVSTTGVHIGTPIRPSPVVAEDQRRQTTCEGGGSPSIFSATVNPSDQWGRFVQLDWFAGGSLVSSNSASLSILQGIPGTYVYGVRSRDMRTGVVSPVTEVVQEVFSLPAVPLPIHENSVLRQCRSEGVQTLRVESRDGVDFEWFLDSVGGSPIGRGDSYLPPLLQTAVYYVEALQQHGSLTCRSATRLRIDHIVLENPETPVPVATSVTVGACAPAVLSVQAREGIQFVWYQSEGNNSWAPFGTNTVVTAPGTNSSVYEVEAISVATGCRSVGRASVAVTVRPLPARPLTPLPDARLVQCRSEGSIPLTVMPVEGVDFEWFDGPSGGVALARGASYAPAQLQARVYYVEAIDLFPGSGCRSATRLRIDHIVQENPAKVEVGRAQWRVSVCDTLPVLSVIPVEGLDYVWYRRDANGGWSEVRTNSFWTLEALESAEFEVEARSRLTGCRSLSRTPVSVVAVAVVGLAPLGDVVAPEDWDGKALPIQAAFTGPLDLRHGLQWTTDGDGSFGNSTNALTSYLPGTNDVLRGSARITVTLKDELSDCATRNASAFIRLPGTPVLEIRQVSPQRWLIEWQPRPSWTLQSCPNPAFDFQREDISVPVDGFYEPPMDQGALFYRLIRKP